MSDLTDKDITFLREEAGISLFQLQRISKLGFEIRKSPTNAIKKSQYEYALEALQAISQKNLAAKS